MKTQSEIAEAIAGQAHAGQFRYDGTPYIMHPARIVAKLRRSHFMDDADDVIAVAWLHDTFEDTPTKPIDLEKAGLSENIIMAVIALTRTEGQSYEGYLQGVKMNPLAARVKFVDMMDNLSDHPTEKQIIKYCKGLLFLLEK